MVIEYKFSQYCKISYDPTTNKYAIKWYNSTTASWETVVEIDASNKQITVHPSVAVAYNFLDDIKLYFGTDNDYSIRYDSTTDSFIIRDEVNAKEVVIARLGKTTIPDNLTVQGSCSFYNNDVKGVGVVTAGTSGTWSAPATVLTPSTGFNTIKPIAGAVKVLNIGAETVSVAVLVVYNDNTTATAKYITGITAVGTYDFTQQDLLNMYANGKYIKEIQLKASSNSATTLATIELDVVAIQT